MTATVTVALKHPHGFILRLHEIVDAPEPQKDGTVKTVKQSRPLPETVTLNGYLTHLRNSPQQPVAQMSAYALTHNVPREFWYRWLEQNRLHDYVVKGLIYASDKSDSIDGHIRDGAFTRCGLEPIDLSALPAGIKGTVVAA